MMEIIAKCIKNIEPYSGEIMDLNLHELYEVDNINMGQSHTFITLKNKPWSFNSVCFKFYENGDKLDIYKDPRFNPYLKKRFAK